MLESETVENSEPETAASSYSMENLDGNFLKQADERRTSPAAPTIKPVVETMSPSMYMRQSSSKIRSKAAKQRDAASKNRKDFADFVEVCRRSSLHRSLNRSEKDYESLLHLDHRYSHDVDDETRQDLQNVEKDFYRPIFLDQFNQLNFPNSQHDILSINGEIDIVSTGCQGDNEDHVEKKPDDAEICSNLLKSLFDPNSAECFDSSSQDNDISWQEKLKKAVNRNLVSIVDRIIKIVSNEILARLATDKRSDESNIRENNLIKNANFLRLSLSSIVDNIEIISLLNFLLVEHLPFEFLTVYLTLLKELNHKAPQVVARIVFVPPDCVDENYRTVAGIVRDFVDSKSVDIGSPFSKFKTTPIAKNPIFVLISPNVKVYGSVSRTTNRCVQFYRYYLPHFGKCFEIKFPPLKREAKMRDANRKLFMVINERMLEIKAANPTKHLVLVGWDMSCFLALYTALDFGVDACVCLSFSNVTLNGLRGDVDDDILDVLCPVLFVVGQFSTTCSLDDLKDTKDRMKSSKVGLVVVGASNSELKCSHNKLNVDNVTQEIVDKCILESVGEFLNDVMVALPDKPSDESLAYVSPVQHQVECSEPDSKKRLIEKNPSIVQPPLAVHTVQATAPKNLVNFHVAPVPSVFPAEMKVSPVLESPVVLTKYAGQSGDNIYGAYSVGQAGVVQFNDTDPNAAAAAAATRTRQIKKPQMLNL